MKIFFTGFVVLMITMNFSAGAQNKALPINGRVTSFDESLPLEGVSISVKGGKNATGTQADGTFTLIISPEEKILSVRLEGYETKEIQITKSREYNIVLRKADTYLPGQAAVNNGNSILKQLPADYSILHQTN